MSDIHTYKPRDDARIEAMRFVYDNLDCAVKWANKSEENIKINISNYEWLVRTLEGWVDLPFGHYLIKGTNGEFYPCDPDVFEKRWQRVSEGEK